MNTHLVIGLGNPGEKYEHTRHNLGIRAVRSLVAACDANTQWKQEEQWPAEVAHVTSDGQSIAGFFPLTFMNKSGEAVAAYMQYFEIPVGNVIIVHDDLETEWGQHKVKHGGSASGHNGVRSIQRALKNDQLTQVRIGIGRPPLKMPAEAYVLSQLTAHEEQELPEVLRKVVSELVSLVNQP